MEKHSIQNIEIYEIHPAATSNFAQHIVMIRPDIVNKICDVHFIQFAKAFQNFGHRVTIITCCKNPEKYQIELENIHVINILTWLPKSILGNFTYPLYLLRTLCLALRFTFFLDIEPRPTIIFSYASSLALPIYRLFSENRLIIHVESPMELIKMCLKTNHTCMNWLLEKSLFYTDEVLVPDTMCCRIFNNYFKYYDKYAKTFFPCVDLELAKYKTFNIRKLIPKLRTNSFLFSCFGEYYNLSNFELVLSAFSIALKKVTKQLSQRMHLVLAGPYDRTNVQQQEYFRKLVHIVKLGTNPKNVTFLVNLNQTQKKCIMYESIAVIFTSISETYCPTIFEAMCLGKTVITTNCGFGKDILIDQITGYLLCPYPEDFAVLIQKLVQNKILPLYIGNLAETDFKYKYSFPQFCMNLNALVWEHSQNFPCFKESNLHKLVSKYILLK